MSKKEVKIIFMLISGLLVLNLGVFIGVGTPMERNVGFIELEKTNFCEGENVSIILRPSILNAHWYLTLDSEPLSNGVFTNLDVVLVLWNATPPEKGTKRIFGLGEAPDWSTQTEVIYVGSCDPLNSDNLEAALNDNSQLIAGVSIGVIISALAAAGYVVSKRG
jgi:hypothetical protein